MCWRIGELNICAVVVDVFIVVADVFVVNSVIALVILKGVRH